MDCFQLLKQDHDEVTELFKQCKAAGADKKGKDAFKSLARALAMHTRVEETLFYPRVQEHEEMNSLIEESYEEHQAVEAMLEEMAQMSPQDEEWESMLKQLKENVEHHVKKEETELFPQAAKVIDEDEAKELGEAIEEEKQAMKKGKDKEAKEIFSRLGL